MKIFYILLCEIYITVHELFLYGEIRQDELLFLKFQQNVQIYFILRKIKQSNHGTCHFDNFCKSAFTEYLHCCNNLVMMHVNYPYTNNLILITLY